VLCLATAAHAGGPAVDVDLAAMLPRGDEAVEYWDLVGDFDSGHRLYARFLITNVGPGDRTALAFGHWVTPDGRATAFKNGKREGNWTLAPDRKRLKIGSSVLSLGTATRHFEVDNDKRGIKIFVDIEADGTALAASHARQLLARGHGRSAAARRTRAAHPYGGDGGRGRGADAPDRLRRAARSGALVLEPRRAPRWAEGTYVRRPRGRRTGRRASAGNSG
jgi:hypothetical protein